MGSLKALATQKIGKFEERAKQGVRSEILTRSLELSNEPNEGSQEFI